MIEEIYYVLTNKDHTRFVDFDNYSITTVNLNFALKTFNKTLLERIYKEYKKVIDSTGCNIIGKVTITSKIEDEE
jgi:hypothetical protein